MSKIVPGRKYTFAEVAELRNDPEVAERVLQGYVLRQDLDGTVQWVRWDKATGGGGAFGGPDPKPLRSFEGVWDRDEGPGPWGDLPPIVKRTPQQRVDSLMLKFIGDCRKAGTVPGFSDERISAIVGEAWKTGRNEITAEVVRMVAQHFLEDAQRRAP